MKIFESIKEKLRRRYLKLTSKDLREYYIKMGCNIGKGTRIFRPCRMSSEPYLIEIGENCTIAGGNFYVHDGGVSVLNNLGYFKGERWDKMARIKVGNNVFIGLDASIMGGVTIGDNCIIGAGSVVTKNIPSNSVAAGMPARVICSIDEYYHKAVEKGMFYDSTKLSKAEKKQYLMTHVKPLS